jgi:hypothetical protein
MQQDENGFIIPPSSALTVDVLPIKNDVWR